MIALQNFKFDYRHFDENGTIMVSRTEHQTDPLLGAWGLQLDNDVLLQRNRYGNPMLTVLAERNINQDLAILSGLDNLLFLHGSCLKLDDGKIKSSGLTYKVLASSTEGSWTVGANFGILTPRDLYPDRHTPIDKRPLIVMLEGKFPDAYAGKPVPAWPGGGAGSHKTIDKADPARVIVVGSSHMFINNLELQPNDKRNGSFLLNSIDLLTHAEDVASIRTKQTGAKLIGTLTGQDRLVYYIVMVALMPVLVIVIGVIKLLVRRTGRQRYLVSISGSK
jgi:hypothetical protein